MSKVSDLIAQERAEAAAFTALVNERVAAGMCAECARGYHINHDEPWRNDGACRQCGCEEWLA